MTKYNYADLAPDEVCALSRGGSRYRPSLQTGNVFTVFINVMVCTGIVGPQFAVFHACGDVILTRRERESKAARQGSPAGVGGASFPAAPAEGAAGFPTAPSGLFARLPLDRPNAAASAALRNPYHFIKENANTQSTHRRINIAMYKHCRVYPSFVRLLLIHTTQVKELLR